MRGCRATGGPCELACVHGEQCRLDAGAMWHHEIMRTIPAPDPEDERTVAAYIREHAPALRGRPIGSGYTGNACRACGSWRVRRTGTCATCEDCGETTGCA